MIKLKAQTLEEIYKEASKKLKKPIKDIEFNIKSYPSKSKFTIFGKNYVVEAKIKGENANTIENSQKSVDENLTKEPTVKKYNQYKKHIRVKKNEGTRGRSNFRTMFDNSFYRENSSKDEIILEIKNQLISLISKSCYKVSLTDINFLEDKVIYIKIDGEDSAILIGKNGGRYEALSYMLQNWIFIKYDINVKLEIADFLKRKEDSVKSLLEKFKESIERGEVVKINKLNNIFFREVMSNIKKNYPKRSVVVKNNSNNTKLIIINASKDKELR